MTAAGPEPVDALHGVHGGHEREADEGEPEPGFRHCETQQQAAEEQQGGDDVQQVEARLETHRRVGSAQSADDGNEAEHLQDGQTESDPDEQAGYVHGAHCIAPPEP